MIESCLLSAIQEAPGFGLPWFRLASWCYRQGWDLLDHSEQGKAAEVLMPVEMTKLLGLVSLIGSEQPSQFLVDELFGIFRRVILDDSNREEGSLSMKVTPFLLLLFCPHE